MTFPNLSLGRILPFVLLWIAVPAPLYMWAVLYFVMR